MTDQELNSFVSELFNVPEQEWVEGKAVIPLSKLSQQEGLDLLKILMPDISKQFYSLGNTDPYLFYWLVMTISNKTVMQALYTLKGKKK